MAYAHIVEFIDSFGSEWQVSIFAGEPRELNGCLLHSYVACRYFTSKKHLRNFLREHNAKVTQTNKIKEPQHAKNHLSQLH